MKTQQDYYQQYVNNVKALNPKAIPDAPATDWWVKANVIGGIASGLSQDIYSYKQSIFLKFRSGSALDETLASYRLLPRSAGTPATGYCRLVATQSSDITLIANTKLSISNNQYFVQETTFVEAGSLGNIPIQSINIGSGYQLANGTELDLDVEVNGITKLVVLSMTDGADRESDNNVRIRIEESIQSPKLGGTKEDYREWAMSRSNITNAYPVANILEDGVLSVFVLSGTNELDVILSKPNIVYNRTTTVSDIANVQSYIETKRPENDNVLVSTTDTLVYTEANTINIGVRLIQNLALTTLLSEFNNMSVADLIRREVRRAFISTPLYGTKIGNLRYILLGDIVKTIDAGLNSIDSVRNTGFSSIGGIYAQILIDRKVDYKGTQDNIPINETVQEDNNLYLIYDINYVAINIYVLQD